MKRRTLHILLGILAGFVLLFFVLFLLGKYEDYQDRKAMDRFEQDIVKAIGLKFIKKDLLYRNSNVRFFGDTVMGYRSRGIEDGPEFFFIKTIKDTSLNVILYRDRSNNLLPHENYIDHYENGCMYFGSYGGSTMQRLCMDGSAKEYFRRYEDTLFYANDVRIYKDKAAITSMNGIYIFNLNTEKLLWSYQHEKLSQLYDGPSVMMENKFVFSDIENRVTCMNMDSMNIEWRIQLTGTALLLYDEIYQGKHSFFYNDKVMALPGTEKFMLIDRTTGQVVWSFPWKASNLGSQPRFAVNDHLVYFTYPSDLKCIDYTRNTIKWQFNNATFRAIYKGYVIAVSKDSKYYLIIDKNTGRLKQRVTNYDQGGLELSFVNNYVIVHRESLYE